MKYYSDLTGKTYPTEKECLAAEADYKKAQEIQENKTKETSKRKKELSQLIELADNKVTEANKLYEIAKEKARKILEESNKQVKDILDKAEEEVKNAEEEKLDAIRNFNKEFGSYSMTYTGTKAIEEYNKAVDKFNKIFRNIFWF